MRYILLASVLVAFLIILELLALFGRAYRRLRFPDEPPKRIDWESVRRHAHMHCRHEALNYTKEENWS